MSLYKIEDTNRPAFVIAKTMPEAIEKWRCALAHEEEEQIDQIREPDGVAFIADDSDVILEQTFLA